MRYSFGPGVQYLRQLDLMPLSSLQSKTKKFHRAIDRGTWLITRDPGSGAVLRVRARRRRGHGRHARYDRPRNSAIQPRLVNERRPTIERRPLALGDDLPHFQFLVQREFFGKL